MKNFKTYVFALFIVGLLYSPTQAQRAAETPQFHFPLEVGNVWVYVIFGFPQCGSNSGKSCLYSRLEVISNNNDGTTVCSNFEHEIYRFIDFGFNDSGFFFREEDVIYDRTEAFQLCQVGNKLYWFDDENDFESDFSNQFMIADFDRDESQPWIVNQSESAFTLRRLFLKSTSEPITYMFESYLAEDETSLTGVFGPEFVYNSQGHFRNNVGFHLLGSYHSLQSLKSSYIDGVLTGDTTFVVPTSIEHDSEYEDGPALLSAYPNPFNPTTEIRYRISEIGRIRIDVMNLLGQRVAMLIDGNQAPGQHSVTFDASGLPSGMYVIVLESEGRRDVRKITLLK